MTIQNPPAKVGSKPEICQSRIRVCLYCDVPMTTSARECDRCGAPAGAPQATKRKVPR